MRVCVVQTKPFKGDIEKNIEDHKRFIDVAAQQKADLIVFPELSITGYEPTLAKDLAIRKEDVRLQIFQEWSNDHVVTIAVGVPTIGEKGIHISLVIFQPQAESLVYSKYYLHADEDPYFVRGNNSSLWVNRERVALAICYELSIAEHTAAALENGANIFIASVVKTARGVEKSVETLSETAATYGVDVLMANGVGICDGEICAGGSAVWNDKGELMSQLDDVRQGLIVWDTVSQEAKQTYLN
jgi:predicted amidohydrolase